MSKVLITEIDRMRELMGMSKIPTNHINENIIPMILNENPIRPLANWVKLLKHSDEVFENIDETKKLIGDLNGYLPKNERFSATWVDDLSKKLVSSKNVIKNAAIADNLGSLSDDAYKELQKLKLKLEKLAASADINKADALFNSKIQSVLSAKFTDPNNAFNKLYYEALDEIFDILEGYRGKDPSKVENRFSRELMEGLLEDEVKRLMKNLGFKLEEYPEFKTFFLRQFKIDFDNYIKRPEETTSGTKHSLLDNLEKEGSTVNLKPILDMQKANKANLRFTRNINKKILSWRGKYNPSESFVDNVTRLKTFPADQILVNEKLSPEFNILIRAIAYDIDQLDGSLKNAKQIWDELIDDLSTDTTVPKEIISKMKEALLYDGKGWLWNPEKLDDYLKELDTRYGIKPDTTFWQKVKDFFSNMSEIWGSLKNILNNGISGVFESVKGLYKTLKSQGVIRSILSAIFTGNIRTPKAIGKLFSKKGFGNWQKFAMNLFIQYAKLLFYKKIGCIIPLAGKLLIDAGLERLGIDTIESNGKDVLTLILEEYTKEMYTSWGELSGYSPVDYSNFTNLVWNTGVVLKTMIDSFLYTDPDVTKTELLQSKQQAFDEYWNSLNDIQKRDVIKLQVDATGGVIGSDFGKLVNFLSLSETEDTKTGEITIGDTATNVNTTLFMQKNNLSVSDLKKIKESLVAYKEISVKLDQQNLDISKVKEVIKNPKNVKKITEKISAENGAIEDKNGQLWSPIYKGDYKFNFRRTNFTEFFDVVTIPAKTVGENPKYAIYSADEFDEVPQQLSVNDVKLGNPKDMNDDGTFDNIINAKETAKNLSSSADIIKDTQPPIDLKTLLQKL